MAYRAVLTYLLIMAFLLAAVTVQAIEKVRAGTTFYSRSHTVQQSFAKQYPENPDLIDHAQNLKKQIDRDTARIASISEALPESVHSVLPVLVLLANQPDKGMLHKLAFTQQSAKNPMKLSFDLMVPEATARNGSPSQAFVQKWKKDPLLAEYFSELKPVRSRRETQDGKPVFITQYEAMDKD